jgi:hypothetical protein
MPPFMQSNMPQRTYGTTPWVWCAMPVMQWCIIPAQYWEQLVRPRRTSLPPD